MAHLKIIISVFIEIIQGAMTHNPVPTKCLPNLRICC